MANEIAYAFIFLLGKKKFPKPKLDNTETNLTEKRPLDSETKKMRTFTFFFTTICNIVLTTLSLWKHIHPTTLQEIVVQLSYQAKKFFIIGVLILCHFTLQEFLGNADRNSVVYHALYPAVSARYIRFRPLAWHNHVSMRVEVFGCQGIALYFPFSQYPAMLYAEHIPFFVKQG